MHWTVPDIRKATYTRELCLQGEHTVQLLAAITAMLAAPSIQLVTGWSVHKVPQSTMEQINQAASRNWLSMQLNCHAKPISPTVPNHPMNTLLKERSHIMFNCTQRNRPDEHIQLRRYRTVTYLKIVTKTNALRKWYNNTGSELKTHQMDLKTLKNFVSSLLASVSKGFHTCHPHFQFRHWAAFAQDNLSQHDNTFRHQSLTKTVHSRTMAIFRKNYTSKNQSTNLHHSGIMH